MYPTCTTLLSLGLIDCALLVGHLFSLSVFYFVCLHPNSDKKITKIIFTSHTAKYVSFVWCRDFNGQCPSFHFYSCQCFIIRWYLLLLFFHIIHSPILPSLGAFSLVFFFRIQCGGQSPNSHKILCGTDVKYYKWETVDEHHAKITSSK